MQETMNGEISRAAALLLAHFIRPAARDRDKEAR